MRGAVHAASIPLGIRWCCDEILVLEYQHTVLSKHQGRDDPQMISVRDRLAVLRMIRDVLQARFDNGPHPSELLRHEESVADDGSAKYRALLGDDNAP